MKYGTKSLQNMDTVERKKLYESPAVGAIEMDAADIVCASTEGYVYNSNGLDDDDWN